MPLGQQLAALAVVDHFHVGIAHAGTALVWDTA
jgi:hypothetical protein